MDLVKLLAKIMAFAVTAKRALWLRHWVADSIFKLSLCNIPFNGKVLFGKTLEEAISRATGGKVGSDATETQEEAADHPTSSTRLQEDL